MKKVVIALVAVVAVCAAAVIYMKTTGSNDKPSSSSAVSQQSSSSQTASVKSASSSESVQTMTKQQAIDKIKSEISMDWEKYTVKEESESKILNNKTYRNFTMWDDDYQEGPQILLDPDDGKLYTWAQSDSAPVLASEDKAFDKTVHTVKVTLTDGAMMSYTGKTEDGNQINFRRLGIDLVNFENVKMGDKITVYYTGVIKGSNTERAFVTKLEGIKAK